MGYTHYWNHEPVPASKVKKLLPKLRKILKTTDVPLGDWSGEHWGAYDITDKRFAFNGIGEGSHETFGIDWATSESEFCKTNRKPYDEVVVACLLLLEDEIDSFHWHSDGDGEADYLNAGRALLANAGINLRESA